MSRDRFEAIVRGALDLATSWEFLIGLAIGVLAVFAIWILASPRREPHAQGVSVETLPIGGMLLGAGAALGWFLTDSLNQTVLLGLLLVVFGAGAARILSAGATMVAAATIPGAVLAASARAIGPEAWIEIAVIVAFPALGFLVSEIDRQYAHRGLALPILTISTIGVVATLAEPDRALLLTGVLLPVAVASWLGSQVQIGIAGSYVLAAVMVVSVVVDNEGRQAGIVGGLACLVAVAILAFGGIPDRADTRPAVAWPAWAVVVGHLVLVYLLARVAGLRKGIAAASLIAAATVAATYAFTVAAPLLFDKEKVQGRGLRPPIDH